MHYRFSDILVAGYFFGYPWLRLRLRLGNWVMLTRLCDSSHSLKKKFFFSSYRKSQFIKLNFLWFTTFILIEYTASERFFQELVFYLIVHIVVNRSLCVLLYIYVLSHSGLFGLIFEVYRFTYVYKVNLFSRKRCCWYWIIVKSLSAQPLWG